MSFLYGAPPKMIWLRCGNCSVKELDAIIRKGFDEISAFLKTTYGSLLVIDD
jgi:predicted nuclease of predicted toxin-antitoxin system